MLLRASLLARRLLQSRSGLEATSTACLAKQTFVDPQSADSILGGVERRSLLKRKDPLRGYAKAAKLEEDDDDDDEPAVPIHPRVQKLAEEIMHLNLLEVADLTEILQKRLNISGIPGGMEQMAPAQMPGGAPAAPQVAAEPPPPEKTSFDVKLDAFDAASKIKVIKEIRGITELGLKEAKELVEKSPVIVKAGLNKEEAEELRKKLESVGAKISLE